ncbi:MAG: hypothetical protein ACI3VX_04095 [Faecousia sp.]
MNEAFLAALDMMWKGMAGIFAVMLLLWLCIKVLAKTARKKEKEQ